MAAAVEWPLYGGGLRVESNQALKYGLRLAEQSNC